MHLPRGVRPKPGSPRWVSDRVGPSVRQIVIPPRGREQREELKKFLASIEGVPEVTFARYTGQESNDEKKAIRNNPPDILLTNFMMLELLMTRQSELDQAVIDNCQGLNFIVFSGYAGMPSEFLFGQPRSSFAAGCCEVGAVVLAIARISARKTKGAGRTRYRSRGKAHAPSSISAAQRLDAVAHTGDLE
jgi:hypothetical protein